MALNLQTLDDLTASRPSLHSSPSSFRRVSHHVCAKSLPENPNAIVKRVLPAEILDLIVLVLLDDNHCSFSSIANFSLSSFQFRQIALKRAFYRLNLMHSDRAWNSIPGLDVWVRCVILYMAINI